MDFGVQVHGSMGNCQMILLPATTTAAAAAAAAGILQENA